jgi:hypothetical protein
MKTRPVYTDKYDSRLSTEAIFFEEGQGKNHVRGVVVQDGEWWVATLTDAEGEIQGTVRLRYKPSQDDWHHNIVPRIKADTRAGRKEVDTAPDVLAKFEFGEPRGYEDDEKNATQDTDNDEVVKRAIRRQPFCFESVGKLGLRISPDDEPTYLTIDEVREDGSAWKWNRTADLSQTIYAGDEIIAVNGRGGNAQEMLNIIKETSKVDDGHLTLTIRPPLSQAM